MMLRNILNKSKAKLHVAKFHNFSKESFKVVEVGPRDGLQNEKQIIPTKTKVELINKLTTTGLKTVEATSYVSPKWVPQMADHNEVISLIEHTKGVSYPVLVPNMAGLNNALKNKDVKEIAVFGAASNTFSKKNTNCTIDESLVRLKEVTKHALDSGLTVRGYVSCIIGCPYEGKINPKIVANITEQLIDAGCYEVSLGDTIGVGSAGSMDNLLNEVLKAVPASKLAVHCHDTYGQALTNVLVAIEKGIRTADSSVAGLGGCPYAKGATGNLATEDLVYMLHDLGFKTGINIDKLVETGNWICNEMKRENVSKASNALKGKISN
ncbi:3-hydroxymethyl-3-methylglutaryl-CoA lyase, cytoplasmic [Strongyloides ratti]|uniref:hydroxymethylglutaryl-CoA lyase n=1 Tax=Strongyloides ratti TaxID=34506 RepID=A0A090MWV3_STRRB|nr:3-hydroxymethyl-3-methylglutaryl-CoA lyase, cytoplasmic [Strongyloides ratti]CEF64334.1 3-hydroxymethyl-3-methylglutaryl-CoA lyase, cytoplasmic [Strongyloides ratti]